MIDVRPAAARWRAWRRSAAVPHPSADNLADTRLHLQRTRRVNRLFLLPLGPARVLLLPLGQHLSPLHHRRDKSSRDRLRVLVLRHARSRHRPRRLPRRHLQPVRLARLGVILPLPRGKFHLGALGRRLARRQLVLQLPHDFPKRALHRRVERLDLRQLPLLVALVGHGDVGLGEECVRLVRRLVRPLVDEQLRKRLGLRSGVLDADDVMPFVPRADRRLQAGRGGKLHGQPRLKLSPEAGHIRHIEEDQDSGAEVEPVHLLQHPLEGDRVLRAARALGVVLRHAR
mmetsp:Transcript_19030/g.56143  ORF Transcript_19030/g.56143 Transcript_19030/m.56143 type:complete len:286 (+) Transcript_19030:191-1048(+)